MRVLRRLASLAVGLLLSGVVLAQNTECPVLVEKAIQASSVACSNLGRNQICYGNVKAQAFDHDGTSLTFEQIGDKVALKDVSKLITFPMNVADNSWGVAILSLQANLPDTLPGQNVSMVAFGDVSLENDVKADAPSFAATAKGKINVRSGPATTFDLAGTINKGDLVTVIGRNDKGDWLQVSLDKGAGWIFASLLSFKDDASTLTVSDGAIPYNQPMQAFSFHANNAGKLACTDAPEDGLLIQSPQHVTVYFRVNGIDVQLGSTAVIRATPNNTVRILNLDGNVVISPNTNSVPLLPGQFVDVGANNATSTVQTYTADDVRALPLRLLPDSITLVPVISSIQPHNVIGNGAVNIFPIAFVNGDGDAIVAIRQTLVSTTSGNWFSGDLPVTPNDYTNATDGVLNYRFSCNGNTSAVTVVYDLSLVDAAGNVSPPTRYTTTCTPA